MNVQVVPPSSERNTPLPFGSGGALPLSASTASASGCHFSGSSGGARGSCTRRCLAAESAAATAARSRTALGRRASAGAAAGAGFHLRVDDLRVRAENRHRDASVDAILRFGPARTFELGPGIAAVGGFPQSAAGASAVISPPGAAALERRRVEDLRIRRIDGDVVEAGIGIDVFRLFPGLAAVRRFVQAAIRIGAEQMPTAAT